MKLFNALVLAGVALGVRVFDGPTVQDDINRCADNLMVNDKLCTGLSITCYLEYFETVCHGKLCFDKPNPEYLKKCNYLANEDDIKDDSSDSSNTHRKCEFKNMCDINKDVEEVTTKSEASDIKEVATESRTTPKSSDVKEEVSESESNSEGGDINEESTESESSTSGSTKNIRAFSLTILAIAHLLTL